MANERGEAGFIDLVVANGHGTSLLVVECKRVRDADWIFLAARGTSGMRSHTKIWVTRRRVDGIYTSCGWQEMNVDPVSREAEFCVVRGQAATNGSRPMLERVAGEVTSSTESLALQEKGMGGCDFSRTYTSVVVRTARLQFGSFEPAEISLSYGLVGEADFEEVPFIRFRKELAINAVSFGETEASHVEMARSRESTVVVINASYFAQFLVEFELSRQSAQRFA